MKADSVVRSTCPYCGVGCQVLLNVKDDHIFRVDAPFDTAPNYGRLCVKGRFGTDYVHHPDRLKTPLIRKEPQKPGQRTPANSPDDWREATWEEAIEFAAKGLAHIHQTYGPDTITSNACAKATNEENYLHQKLMRGVLGTNNVDHCARLCHAASVTGLQLVVGSSAMSNSIAEMKNLECFIVTGSNTTETHPVISTFLKQAVTQNGAKLIVADPRQTEMTQFADIWLRQKSGTDVAVFNAIAHVIVKEGLYDEDFIGRRTEGFSDYIESLEEKTPEWAEEISGVPADDIRRAARMYGQANRAAIYWGMGISQSTHGTDNTLTLANIALMTGNLGKTGAGLNPLRGQNNVQGCSDSGGLPNVYTAYQKVTDADVRQKFEKYWYGSDSSRQLSGTPGLTVTEMVDGILTGKVKGWWVMGENPMMSEPNMRHAQEAIEHLEFFVSQDIFFNETNVYADVIFPAAAFAEKNGTFTNSDRRVQRVRKSVPPVGQARADWEIICDLGKRLEQELSLQTAGWEFNHPSEIWEEMRQLTPDFGGIDYDRLDREGGVHWPCPDFDHPGTPYLFTDEFPSGRGTFHAVEYGTESELPDEDFPFILSTGRVLYHWHGGTLTRPSVLNDIWPECTVELHPNDAARLVLSTGDWVDLSSRRGKITARLLVTGRSPEGTVFIPFHFAEAAANVLTDNRIDTRAKIPDYKVCGVKIERASTIPTDRVGADIPLEDRGAIKDMALA